MFSINLRWNWKLSGMISPLHSTMFSINPILFLLRTCAERTLHSTMFSINLLQSSMWGGKDFLYIPLCFLLILKRRCVLSSRRPLHSTMFSINHLLLTVWQIILFSLHSTMFSINRIRNNVQAVRDALYIPLCFLLIRKLCE